MFTGNDISTRPPSEFAGRQLNPEMSEADSDFLSFYENKNKSAFDSAWAAGNDGRQIAAAWSRWKTGTRCYLLVGVHVTMR